MLVLGGGVSVLTKSSTLSITLASLTRSKKIDPLELKGTNIKVCILDSVKLACVDIDSILVYLLSIDKREVYSGVKEVHTDVGRNTVN